MNGRVYVSFRWGRLPPSFEELDAFAKPPQKFVPAGNEFFRRQFMPLLEGLFPPREQPSQ